MNTDPRTQRLVGTIFPIIGVLLLVGSIVSATFTYRFISTASRAEGKVVKLNAGGAHPSIEFIPSSQKTVIEFSGSGFIDYAVGDKVTVLYLKDEIYPSGFKTNIDNPGALWFETSMFLWLGAGFIIGGLYTRRISQQEEDK